MAKRPVFLASTDSPYYEECDIEFKYYSGFSLSQKQKCIKSLHEEFLIKYQNHKVLEASSKSPEKTGVLLSAFNLQIPTSTGKRIYVENAFQGSKVFENGGPYYDLYNKDAIQAKRDPRLKNSGKIVGFRYFDTEVPSEPKGLFYNWLYIKALIANKDLCEKVKEFDAFTDIEFNPKKSLNCQARALAIYVGLWKANKNEDILTSNIQFMETVYGGKNSKGNYKQMTLSDILKNDN